MKQQSKFRKVAGLISLGYLGGTIYLLMYVRYCFYDLELETVGINNTQLGLVATVGSVVAFITQWPGAFLADKLDSKKIIVFTGAVVTGISFIYAFFVHSYAALMAQEIAQDILMMSYWAALIKYINNMGDEDEAGSSFGNYYLINGISGALGNIIPIYFSQHYGFAGVIVCYGVITLIGTIAVFFFLDDEKQLAERGIYLKGDEPVRLKHIPLVLKWPGFWIILFAYTTTYCCNTNLSYFTPYLTQVVGIDPDATAVVAVIRSYAITPIAAPIGGFMADKVLKSTSSWYITAFTIIAVLLAIPLTFGPETNATFVTIYSLLPALAVYALYCVTYSIMRELHIPTTVSATAIGVSTGIASLLLAPFSTVFGHFIDAYGNDGFKYIFITLIGVCILGILNALWAKKLDKKCKAGYKMDLSSLGVANSEE